MDKRYTVRKLINYGLTGNLAFSEKEFKKHYILLNNETFHSLLQWTKDLVFYSKDYQTAYHHILEWLEVNTREKTLFNTLCSFLSYRKAGGLLNGGSSKRGKNSSPKEVGLVRT